MRALFAAGWVCLAACSSRPVGQPCTLVKPGPDGGLVPILEQEVTLKQAYLSFGDPQCTSGICLRDANFDAGDAAPTSPAQGYCSDSCGKVGQGCNSAVQGETFTCQDYGLTIQSIQAACDAGSSAPCGAVAELSSPYLCSE